MKFSIVTITHNRAHLIDKTIESVLNQTYPNFEHIIIDDGSTDSTEEIIESINDDRIKYFYYEKHSKRSFLRNEGIRKSTGNVICILDSDDIWVKEKLETLYYLYTNQPKIVCITHNAIIKDTHDSNNNFLYNFKEDFFKIVLKEILSDKFLPYPFYSFKKSILKSINSFDETLTDGQHDFFLRLASIHPIYYCAKILAFKIKHENSISSKKRVSALLNYNISLNNLLESNKITLLEHKRIVIINNYKIAKYYFKTKELQNSLTYFNKVISQTPLLHKLHIKGAFYKLLLLNKFTKTSSNTSQL